MQDFIDKNCHYLSEGQILDLNKNDSGAVNNVIVGLEPHSYGMWLLNDGLDENYVFFYINGTNGLSGITCHLNIHDTDSDEKTFAFTRIINQEYPNETDLIDTFNTFQNLKRTLYEKLEYFTIGNELNGKSGTIVTNKHKGIKQISFIEKSKAFTYIFKSSILIHPDNLTKENWIYLMFNKRNGYTKIGRSINPRAREKTLQGEDPETNIIAYWKAEKTIEKELHRKFSIKRIRGEWFNLDISDLLEIETIMTK